MPRKVFSCLLIAVAAALPGCRAGTADVSSQGNPALQPGRVQFEDASTRRIVEVVRTDTDRLPGGLLKVTVTLRNKTAGALWADIRTSFLGPDGQMLEQTSWEPTLLSAKALAEYACTSTSDRAVDYRVVIRKPAKSLGLP